jgi:hypothetical protein
MKLDPYGTKVPEGRYRVNFLRYDKGIAFGTPRWFGHFTITQEGPSESVNDFETRPGRNLL